MKKLVLQEACLRRRLAGMRRFICAAILMLGTAGMAMAQEDETTTTEGEDSTSTTTTSTTVIYFTSSALSDTSTATLGSGNITSGTGGTLTYNSTTYSYYLKMESSTSLTLNISEETKVTLYFTSSNSSPTVKIGDSTVSLTSATDVTASSSSYTAYSYTTTLSDTTTITKGTSNTFLFLIVLETATTEESEDATEENSDDTETDTGTNEEQTDDTETDTETNEEQTDDTETGTGTNEEQTDDTETGTDEEGEDSTSTTTTSTTVIYFTSSDLSDTSTATLSKGSMSKDKGTLTYNSTTYEYCLKMESSTSLTLNISEETKVTLYFTSNTTSPTVKIGGTAVDLTSTTDVTANESGYTAYSYTTTLSDTTEITKGTTDTYLYLIVLETATTEESEDATYSLVATVSPSTVTVGTVLMATAELLNDNTEEAVSDSVTYQWYTCTSAESYDNAEIMTDSTAASFQVNTTTADTLYYYCTAVYGDSTYTSNIVTVTIMAAEEEEEDSEDTEEGEGETEGEGDESDSSDSSSSSSASTTITGDVIYFTNSSATPSDSRATVNSGSGSSIKGSVTYNGVEYTYALKLEESKGSITVTPDSTCTMTLYLTYELPIDESTAATVYVTTKDSEGNESTVLDTLDYTGSSTTYKSYEYGIYTVTLQVEAGQTYTITKGENIQSNLFLIVFTEAIAGGSTSAITDDDDNELVIITYGGDDDSWTTVAGSDNGDGSSGTYVRGNEQATDEQNETFNHTNDNNTFDMPIDGSFLMIEPQTDGTMTVIVRKIKSTNNGENYVCDEHGDSVEVTRTTSFTSVSGDTIYITCAFTTLGGGTYFLMGESDYILSVVSTSFNKDDNASATDVTLSETTTDDSSVTTVDESETTEESTDENSDESTETTSSLSNVTFERTFTKGGWTGIVLPFSVSPYMFDRTFGTDADMIHFDDVSSDGVLNLVHHYYGMLVAGTPVFICPDTTVTSDNYMTFSNVTYTELDVENTVAESNTNWMITGSYTATTTGANVYMLGFTTTTTTDDDGNSTTSVDTNSFYHYSSAQSVKGTRAWIQQTENTTSGAKLITAVSVDGISDDTESTGILEAINGSGTSTGRSNDGNGNIYNLNGQMVRTAGSGTSGLQKGIYIINGKKITIK